MGVEIILRNHFPNTLINTAIAKKKIIRNAHGIKMARSAILENFKRPYLSDASPDRLRVWF